MGWALRTSPARYLKSAVAVEGRRGCGARVNLLQRLGYLWARRRVVADLIGNWLAWLVHEAGRQRIPPGQPVVICVRRVARTRIHNHAVALKAEGHATVLVAMAFDYHYHRGAFDAVVPWARVEQIPAIITRLMRRHPVKAVIGSLQPAAQMRELLAMDLARISHRLRLI